MNNSKWTPYCLCDHEVAIEDQDIDKSLFEVNGVSVYRQYCQLYTISSGLLPF